MAHFSRNREAIVAELAVYDVLLEVGIGRRTDLAQALLEGGCTVRATDIHPRSTPEEVAFKEDDITDPSLEFYRDVNALYARHLPPELHRPTAAVAAEVGATCYFTTLGGEQPQVPVERLPLPRGVLYRVSSGSGPG